MNQLTCVSSVALLNKYRRRYTSRVRMTNRDRATYDRADDSRARSLAVSSHGSGRFYTTVFPVTTQRTNTEANPRGHFYYISKLIARCVHATMTCPKHYAYTLDVYTICRTRRTRGKDARLQLGSGKSRGETWTEYCSQSYCKTLLPYGIMIEITIVSTLMTRTHDTHD